MARTQSQIKRIMTDSFMANPTVIELYELTPDKTYEEEFSLISLENILFEIVAFCIWSLESLWDIFKAETETEMAKQRPHTKEWYRQKALGYRHGVPVISGTDAFDLTGLTEEQITTATVINQAACVKLISSNGYGILRVKVATADNAGELQQVPDEQFQGLKQYMLRYVVDAGTQVKLTTGPADDLRLIYDVYYDPLVLSTTGARLDGTADTPVQDATTAFLGSIEFNGMLILSDLEKALRQVPGVRIAKVKEAASKYANYSYDTTGVANAGVIDEIRVADSGYMKVDSLEINFKPMPE